MTARTDEEQTERDDLANALRGTKHLPRTISLIERVRSVVHTKGAARIDGLLVDLFTASAIVNVHDALNEKNRATYAAMPVRRMADLAFKLIN